MHDRNNAQQGFEKASAKVTRVEVIDDNGRAYAAIGVSASVSFQDSGRTLKIFVSKLREARDA